jgi:CRISPR type I-E-associated protein CasB/Cse2
MTGESDTATPSQDARDDERVLVARLAGRFQGEGMSNGDRANLRRMDPRKPGRASLALYRLFADVGLAPRGEEMTRRWTLVVHCLALARGRHAKEAPTGKVLFDLPLTEGRFNMLMAADMEVLFDLLPRLARRLDAKPAVINWGPLALLALYGDAKMGDRQRQQIAQEFARASYKSSKESAA